LLSTINRKNLRFPLNDLNVLRPWSADLDSNSSGQIDSMSKDQANKMLMLSAVTENKIAIIYMHTNLFNLAETHCERGLSFARLYKGTEDEKTDLLCRALRTFYEIRREEDNHADALTFAEEAYGCVAVAYNPVHPKVQKAASALIECLTDKGDLCNAELFAQMTLDSLKDPQNGLDQQSEAVANCYND
jgi:hypothetical protein